MNEADRKRELVRAVKAIGGHARRIEDSWAVGVLDMIIKLPGVPVVFAEGKIIKGTSSARRRLNSLMERSGFGPESMRC